MTAEQNLTEAEYVRFRARRLKVVYAAAVSFVYAAVLAAIGDLINIESHLGVVFLVSLGLVLWALSQMFRFKCPRCGVTPMTTRPSLGSGEVVVTGYVALNPKKCHKCGVSFRLPTTDAV